MKDDRVGREGGSRRDWKRREGGREGRRDVLMPGTAQRSPAMMERREPVSFRRPEVSRAEPS